MSVAYELKQKRAALTDRLQQLERERVDIQELMRALDSDDPGERLASQSALADRKSAQTLHVLVLPEAAVDAILSLVFRADVAASVLAVNLDLAIEYHLLPAPRDGLAQLHEEHPSRLVLNADFTRELERRLALHRVRREPDGDKHLFQAQLTCMKHRA